jgi:hypothetical protein
LIDGQLVAKNGVLELESSTREEEPSDEGGDGCEHR